MLMVWGLAVISCSSGRKYSSNCLAKHTCTCLSARIVCHIHVGLTRNVIHVYQPRHTASFVATEEKDTLRCLFLIADVHAVIIEAAVFMRTVANSTYAS